MTGFTYRPASGTTADRRRSSRSLARAEYIPIKEKTGFWPNHGAAFLTSVGAFGVALFVLVFGWSHGLELGGLMYYSIALAGVVLTAAFPIQLLRRYYKLQRIVDGADGAAG